MPTERKRENKRLQQSPGLDGNKHKVLRIIVWTEMTKIHVKISQFLNMSVQEMMEKIRIHPCHIVTFAQRGMQTPQNKYSFATAHSWEEHANLFLSTP